VTVWGSGTVNVNSASPLTLYALTCSGAPTSELCTDPTGQQMQLFVMGLTMGQAITMGAPLFGSPGDFMSMVKGQGMLGPMLAGLGLKPVKFQSESDFAKSLTTESKVFSIYAVGVVKGFRRETRVKIHTVIDMRQAPSLTGGGSGSSSSSSTSSSTTPGTTAGGQQLPAGVTDPNALAAALQPNVGGQVLYYDIE
jgi:general secretion pathway protein K